MTQIHVVLILVHSTFPPIFMNSLDSRDHKIRRESRMNKNQTACICVTITSFDSKAPRGLLDQ